MGKNKYGKGYESKGTSSKDSKSGGAPIHSGKIKASHILVDKYNKAQEIYEDVQAGENFEDLARQFSTCSSKKRGGNLGDFSKGDMVSEFWNACTKLKIGEISQPVKSKFGYHVIKRTG
ncbi:MAG: peptidyl-prolyl cis-trans isomerase [Candidatus Lokiarchaeota archaeon]|nr:peptidyl-prolyl cis-trans isomerase [Candidatus Lokiarchaeota archaeon]